MMSAVQQRGERGDSGGPAGSPLGMRRETPGNGKKKERTFTPSHTLNIALHVYSHGVLVEVLVLVLVGVSADLLVVLLEGGDVLPGLAELSFLHTLSDVPVDEGPLAVHEVELVVGPAPDLGDGGGVRDHEA